MSVSLKGCDFEYTELPVHFASFNHECAIVKEANKANLLSQELKLTRANLQLNLCPSNLKRILFNTLKSVYDHEFSGTQVVIRLSDYDMQYKLSR